MHNDSDEQLVLIMYQKWGDCCQFVFSFSIHSNDHNDPKKKYFFVQKSKYKMVDIFISKKNIPILQEETEILVFDNDDKN